MFDIGPLSSGSLGPKMAAPGQPAAAARCIRPLSLLTQPFALRTSLMRSYRSSFPARLKTFSESNPALIMSQTSFSEAVPEITHDPLKSAVQTRISSVKLLAGHIFAGKYSAPGATRSRFSCSRILVSSGSWQIPPRGELTTLITDIYILFIQLFSTYIKIVSGQSICATNGQLKMCHFKMR